MYMMYIQSVQIFINYLLQITIKSKKTSSFKYGKCIHDHHTTHKAIGWNILAKYEILLNEGYKDIRNDVFLPNRMTGLVSL